MSTGDRTAGDESLPMPTRAFVRTIALRTIATVHPRA